MVAGPGTCRSPLPVTLATHDAIPIMFNWSDIPETEMRSQLPDDGPRQERRAWEAPAFTELPIKAATRAAVAGQLPPEPQEPPAPGAPATKLGFSFEMSFPLSVRTE